MTTQESKIRKEDYAEWNNLMRERSSLIKQNSKIGIKLLQVNDRLKELSKTTNLVKK